MIFGQFRDGHPRIFMGLPGHSGSVRIEFIVDTGFEGDIALPLELANQVMAEPSGYSDQRLGDGRIEAFEVREIEIEWGDERRITQVLVLGGEPLIGTVLLRDMLLQVEIAQGGEVSIVPL